MNVTKITFYAKITLCHNQSDFLLPEIASTVTVVSFKKLNLEKKQMTYRSFLVISQILFQQLSALGCRLLLLSAGCGLRAAGCGRQGGGQGLSFAV